MYPASITASTANAIPSFVPAIPPMNGKSMMSATLVNAFLMLSIVVLWLDSMCLCT